MNKLKVYSIMLFATLALATVSCSDSKNNSETNTEKDADNRNEDKFARADEKDAKYVVDAYTAGMIEIRTAERVKDRLTTQDAKDVAAMMITEHTAMNNDMRMLATKKQISLPTELTKAQQDDIDDLAGKTGWDLDEAYTDGAIKDHKDAVDLFENASTKASDPEIQTAFANGLPKLRTHLDMATTAHDNVKKMKK